MLFKVSNNFDILGNYYMQSPNQQQRTNLLPSRMQPQSLPQSHQPPHPPQLPPQQASPQQSMQQPDASGNRPKRYSSLRQRPTVSENPPQQNYQPQHTQVTQHVQHPQHTQHGYFSPQGKNYSLNLMQLTIFNSFINQLQLNQLF